MRHSQAKTWYVRELSRLAGVTVRTLHHYDSLGLLCPSIRQENGYRVYSEGDVLRLQRIVALKFFGFSLERIQELLRADRPLQEDLMIQANLLDQQVHALEAASRTLKTIVTAHPHSATIPWQMVIQTIEVYKMTQKLQETWAGRALSPQEMDAFAHFYQDVCDRLGQKEVEKIERAFFDLIQMIPGNLDQDPTGSYGQKIAQDCETLMNRKFLKEHRHLKNMVWEKAVKSGELGIAPETVKWLDQAMTTFYDRKIHHLLAQTQDLPPTILEQLWESLMEDRVGNSVKDRQALIEATIKDPRTSPQAKTWLNHLKK